MAHWKNQLYYGDNHNVPQRCVKDESVDLAYLDPLFNSRQDYNIFFAEKDGSQSNSQIRALSNFAASLKPSGPDVPKPVSSNDEVPRRALVRVGRQEDLAAERRSESIYASGKVHLP